MPPSQFTNVKSSFVNYTLYKNQYFETEDILTKVHYKICHFKVIFSLQPINLKWMLCYKFRQPSSTSHMTLISESSWFCIIIWNNVKLKPYHWITLLFTVTHVYNNIFLPICLLHKYYVHIVNVILIIRNYLLKIWV